MNNTLISMATYNHYPFTYLALKSMYDNTPELRDGTARLIVQDNNSTDETQKRILVDFPWISEFFIADKDCIPYQQNCFLSWLKENEDYCFTPNDFVFGKNWLTYLKEDLYSASEQVKYASPYCPVDLQNDAIVNQQWSERYSQIYANIREVKQIGELENYLKILYGDFDQFCIDFEERNRELKSVDSSITHCILFKSEIFKDGFRFNEKDYPLYFGAWEYDFRCELNNRNYLGITSMRSYCQHWISISNRDSNIELSEKQKEIRKNNLKLFQRWEWIPGSTYFSPSGIIPYHKWSLREKEINSEEASKVPGSKFLVFDGLTPGHNYFEQIQPGSIITDGKRGYKVLVRKQNGDLVYRVSRFVCGLGMIKEGFSLSKERFINENWSILYFLRPEEEKYFGFGHMNFLLSRENG